MKIEILSIKDSEDGEDTVIEFDLDQECKNQIKKIMGLKRLTRNNFEKFVLNSIELYLKDKE